MQQYGDLYSKYYDLIYSEKSYEDEIEYIHKLINESSKHVMDILDLGCGTGKHADLLCDKGYRIHGVDLSDEMLKIAADRRKGKEDKLTFTNSNIQELSLNKKFDVVVSLFHVMSYQTTNNELIKTFEVVKDHLKKGGIFIFDFWYGPAVLTDLPTNRVKRIENKNIKVTRIAEPFLNAQKNLVDVNYDVFIEDKKTNEIKKKKELHKMRYLFDNELDIILSKIGLNVLQKYKWMSLEKPDFNSWNVVWIVKN